MNDCTGNCNQGRDCDCCECCESPGPGVIFLLGAAILYGAAMGFALAWLIFR